MTQGGFWVVDSGPASHTITPLTGCDGLLLVVYRPPMTPGAAARWKMCECGRPKRLNSRCECEPTAALEDAQ